MVYIIIFVAVLIFSNTSPGRQTIGSVDRRGAYRSIIKDGDGIGDGIGVGVGVGVGDSAAVDNVNKPMFTIRRPSKNGDVADMTEGRTGWSGLNNLFSDLELTGTAVRGGQVVCLFSLM